MLEKIDTILRDAYAFSEREELRSIPKDTIFCAYYFGQSVRFYDLSDLAPKFGFKVENYTFVNTNTGVRIVISCNNIFPDISTLRGRTAFRVWLDDTETKPSEEVKLALHNSLCTIYRTVPNFGTIETL